MSNRFAVKRDFYAGLFYCTDDADASDWAVYDTARADPEDRERPLAVFAFRSDARTFARLLNKTRRTRSRR